MLDTFHTQAHRLQFSPVQSQGTHSTIQPSKRHQQDSETTPQAITEARIQEKSSESQHGIFKSFEATQHMTRDMALCTIGAGMALIPIAIDWFVNSDTVWANLSWDTKNKPYTLRDYACSKMNCQGYILTTMIYFAYVTFMLLFPECVVGFTLPDEHPVEKVPTRVRWTCVSFC